MHFGRTSTEVWELINIFPELPEGILRWRQDPC